MADALDLDRETDALFRLDPKDFVAARNALGKALKKEGRKDDAARVAALTKPTPAAFAVNRIAHVSRAEIDALLDAGAALRDATARGASMADAAAANKAYRDRIATLVERAEAILAETGHGTSIATSRRIQATLEALAAQGRDAATHVAGRLTDDLEPPGFEAFGGLVPVVAAAPVAASVPAAVPPPAPAPALAPVAATAAPSPLERILATFDRARTRREQAHARAAEARAAVEHSAAGRDAAAAEVARLQEALTAARATHLAAVRDHADAEQRATALDRGLSDADREFTAAAAALAAASRT
jgi:hypothetical protein